MAKRIYIGGRLESVEQGNVVAGANAILDDTKGKKQNVINSETDAELLRLSNEKQDNLTFDNAPTENSNNPVKSGGVWTADKALQDAIEAILLLIPSAATALNKLVDEAQMNDKISTASATFRGTYTSVQALDNVQGDANDYAYVSTTDAVGNSTYDKYKYVEGTGWVFEYKLNNNAFTATEWAAIQSGITAALVGKLSDLPTAEHLITTFAGKQDVLTFDDAPTLGSNNPVKSSGIKTELNTKQPTLVVGTNLDANPTEDSTNPVTSGGVWAAINAIAVKISAEASSSNQLADKAWVVSSIAAAILAAIPSFKGQFTSLADLLLVESPKAGDLGIVRTTDSDGYAVFTMYQFLNDIWNVFYTLSHHNLKKPATTGTTGDYPYNGMGRVELAKNIVNGVNTLTQDMFYKGDVGSRVPNTNTVFVIKYDYVLGENITIPDNCVLKFKGGSISGTYTITGNNTTIYSDTKDCLKDVLFAGTFKGGIKVSWLGLPNTYNSRNIVILHSLSLACQNIIWDTDDVYVSWQADYNIMIHKGFNDFRNTKFHAKNDTDDWNACLFVYTGELLDFETQPSTLAGCIASSVFTGQFGCLVINDQTPMTTRNQGGGSSYNIYRRDIIGVSGNAALNEPILPYDSDGDTVLEAHYFIIDYSNITIKNLVVIREWSSTQRFNVLSVKNAFNVILENAFIQVDESRVSVTYDVATSFNNVYNLKVVNYTMDGSFSYSGQYAYGLNLDNVYNLMIDNVQDGDNGWEMIAGNCMNKVVCRNSNLKLLDCHFYSKDFLFQNCTFRWHGAQCAGHFGYIKFDSCKFNGGQCHYIDSSFGVRTDYDIFIENCVFDNVSSISSCAPVHRATRTIYGNVHKQPNITVNGLIIKNSAMAFYSGAGNGSLTGLEIVTFNHVRKDDGSSINITDAGYNNLERLDIDDYEEQIKSIYQTSSNFINTDKITDTTINITNSKLAIGQWNSVNYSTRRNKILIKDSTVWGLGGEVHNAFMMLIKDCVVLLPKIENTNSYVVPYNVGEPYITFESCYFKTIDGGTYAQGSSGGADSYKAYTRFCVFFDDYANFRKAGLYDWYRMILTVTP